MQKILKRASSPPMLQVSYLKLRTKILLNAWEKHNPDMGDPWHGWSYKLNSKWLQSYYKVTQDERSRPSGKRRTWKVLSGEHWDPPRFQSTKLCSGNGGEMNFQTETQIKVPLSLDQPCNKCLADPHIFFHLPNIWNFNFSQVTYMDLNKYRHTDFLDKDSKTEASEDHGYWGDKQALKVYTAKKTITRVVRHREMRELVAKVSDNSVP